MKAASTKEEGSVTTEVIAEASEAEVMVALEVVGTIEVGSADEARIVNSEEAEEIEVALGVIALREEGLLVALSHFSTAPPSPLSHERSSWMSGVRLMDEL